MGFLSTYALTRTHLRTIRAPALTRVQALRVELRVALRWCIWVCDMGPRGCAWMPVYVCVGLHTQCHASAAPTDACGKILFFSQGEKKEDFSSRSSPGEPAVTLPRHRPKRPTSAV